MITTTKHEVGAEFSAPTGRWKLLSTQVIRLPHFQQGVAWVETVWKTWVIATWDGTGNA